MRAIQKDTQIDVCGDVLAHWLNRWVSPSPRARLTKLWLLTISLNCIEMNRRLLVNNDFILHSLLGKLKISLLTRP